MDQAGTTDIDVLVCQGSTSHHSPTKQLCLLGEFIVWQAGHPVNIAPGGQRILALLALSEMGISRSTLAGMLWPDKTQGRAAANLRSTLWRMPENIRSNLQDDGVRLRLDDHWSVDVVEARRVAAELRGSFRYDPEAVNHFCLDLLPAWSEQWLVVERERFHQLRIHALELLADRQLKAGKPALAAETALLAVSAEPLRESSMSVLVHSEIELGNRAAAVEHYRRFAMQLSEACGAQPSNKLNVIVAPFVDDPTPPWGPRRRSGDDRSA